MIFPQVLTIAGSDSGGGAGIQADIKTFQERKTFGMSVITAITAQNTLGVKAVHKIPVEMIREQCDAIAEDFQVSAVKTGMLADAEIIREVARNIRLHNFQNIVIDPVMIAKGGTALLENEATQVLKDELLPLGTIITPNIPEAEEILGEKITTKAEIEQAAKKIFDIGVKAVVIKGGHSKMSEAADFYYDGETTKWLTSALIRRIRTELVALFRHVLQLNLRKGIRFWIVSWLRKNLSQVRLNIRLELVTVMVQPTILPTDWRMGNES